MTERRARPGSKDKKQSNQYNWLDKKRTKLDDLPEPETDESQLEALMVDCGRTKLLHGWE